MRAHRYHPWLFLLGGLIAAGACFPDVTPAKPGACVPDEKRCADNAVETCGRDYQWRGMDACPAETPFCAAGACSVCQPDQGRCKGSALEVCSGDGEWQAPIACVDDTPFCAAGACSDEPPSCAGVKTLCAPEESCCRSLLVTGGTFNRFENDDSVPQSATVSDFRLDRFEVTVGRFRKFVEAYPGSKPTANAGARGDDDSGWKPEWNEKLPLSASDLMAKLNSVTGTTWTDTPAFSEDLPITGMDWYLAFAFCAWDGGRLPTEAEWQYAATIDSVGSSYKYPWGDDAPSDSHAVYCSSLDPVNEDPCSMAGPRPARVGLKTPLGDGPWGHADLAGNVWEWLLDAYGSYAFLSPCVDCVNASDADGVRRVIRGGAWLYGSYYLPGALRVNELPDLAKERSWGPLRAGAVEG